MWRLLAAAVALLPAACRQADGAAATEASASVDPTAHATSSAAATVTATAPTVTPPVRVAFVGDVNLSLQVGINLERQAKNKRVPADVGAGYPFTHVVDRLRAADLMVGNLECVASTKGSLATDHNPFRCHPSTVARLKEAGFDLMSVANNHALDFGPAGLRGMIDNLEAGGLPHFGRETFGGKPQAPFVFEKHGLRVGLLAYYWPPKTMRDVEAARPDVDVLIAFMHWGREDQPEPLLLQKRLARKLIDAGCDTVVGTHAHVMQPTAWYGGKYIAYGLGNFVFSGMNHTERHRTGGMLELQIHADRRIVPRLLTIRLDEAGAPRFVRPPEDVPEATSPPGGGGPPDRTRD